MGEKKQNPNKQEQNNEISTVTASDFRNTKIQ